MGMLAEALIADAQLPGGAHALPAAGEIHLWCARLDVAERERRGLEQSLSADERERAGRFRFAKDQGRFVVRRGLLRALLGEYLGERPGRLCFQYGPQGKPELARPSGRPLHFNLSHSDGVALYAFAGGGEVGLDVERLRPLAEAEAISRRFFSPREDAVFRAVPAHQKVDAFFNCWTRKEALLKVGGEGLSRPLDSFDVSLRPGEPPAVLAVRGDAAAAGRWSLYHLTPCPGYVGALAVEGRGWRIACRRYEGN